MDYWQALNELYLERQRLDKVIQNLEALSEGHRPAPISRRGRKNMSETERRAVSERMRNYWASRKQQDEPGEA
jgi:hypothetical protein